MGRAPRETDTTTSQAVANFVRDAILQGRMLPGERIKQEDLAVRFGTSRLPVREALRILERDGLVRLVSNSGAWVSQLNMQECVEIYRLREAIEPLLLAESIPQLSAEHLDDLAELSAEVARAAESDLETFLDLDRQFHLQTYSGARSSLARPLVERFWNTTQHYRRAYTRLVEPDRRWMLHYEHPLLLDAMRRGATEEAQAVLTNHIRRTRLSLVEHPDVF